MSKRSRCGGALHAASASGCASLRLQRSAPRHGPGPGQRTYQLLQQPHKPVVVQAPAAERFFGRHG